MVGREEKSLENCEVISSFSDFRGNRELKLLLILLAIDPTINGIVILGITGTGKSLILNLFKQLKIPTLFNKNCAFNCSPSGKVLCKKCNNAPISIPENDIQHSYIPIVKMPVSTSLDALIGSLDLHFSFRPGLFGKANNGYLILDDLHLLAQESRTVLFNTWQRRANYIQRNSVSLEHPSEFCLITTYNPTFHDKNPSWIDKFAFSYHLDYDHTVETHVDIINQNLDKESFHVSPELAKLFNKNSLLIREILRSRDLLDNVVISSEILSLIAEICNSSKLDGIRADITFAKGAKALASFHNRTYVTKEDILLLISPILSHRMPVEDFDDLIEYIHCKQTNKGIESKRKEQKQGPSSKILQKDDKKHSFYSLTEKLVSILSILLICFIVSALLVRFIFTPRLFPVIFGILTLWGVGSFLLYLWVRRRKNLLSQYRKDENLQHQPPEVSSFSQVKSLRLTETTKEDKREFTKKPEIDIEEGNSARGKILQFVGFQKRKGMILITRYQRYWIYVYGIFVLLISTILYIFLLIYLPPEVWIAVLFLLLCLLTIGFLQQYNQEKWRIRRVADIGASSRETSKVVNSSGIGSHITKGNNKVQDDNSMEDYESRLWNKLSKLNIIYPGTENKERNRPMFYFGSTDTQKSISRVIGEKLPEEKALIDTKSRYQAGKRALSLSSSQSGRIIGSIPFKDSPRNIHIMATIMNALRHQKHRKQKNSTKKIDIKLSDVREKLYCARVSATIIFVLDLSESIVNVINTVSASVNWLSRQAYLYRDRVGLVVLQRTQGMIVQFPTSNLNLVKRKLKNLKVSGSTPLPAGIQKALDLIRIDRIRSNNETIPMIVLITDGATNIPLLTNPITGIKRDIPISALGIDSAIKMSINDCLILGQQIKNSKISLVIFSTNIQGKALLQKYTAKERHNPTQFLETLMKTTDFFQGKQFIQLWSYTLLISLRNITKGHLFFLTKEYSDRNFETLRIARSEIITELNS